MLALHKLFEQQAAKFSDRPALFFEGATYTYQQLNNIANQYAHFLQQEYNITKGDRMLVLLPKSSAHQILFLASLKLGAIYAPLTPEDCPPDRLLEIIRNTSPRCIVSQDLEILTEQQSLLLDLNILEESARTLSALNLDTEVSIDDIAYIIYTSGTTGMPKGVPIKHGGLSYWWNTLPILFSNNTIDKKVLGFCLPSFDASIWEYMLAWVTASPLYMTNDDSHNNLDQLLSFITQHSITHATLIPSVLRRMIEAGLPESLQVVCSTGEACTRDIIAAFESQEKSLFNCYGATEETFGLSVQLCSLALFDKQYGAPIAYPIGEEIKTYILDENLEQAETGELYVESPYLSPGYWNQTEETEKHFVNYQNKKLYKSGDCFHRDSSTGLLRCLGRINSEAIKIRGALVGLIEIETYIKEFKEIKEACVTVHDNGYKKILIAHVNLESNTADFSIEKIRAYLLTRLQRFAIPAQFITHTTALPLTSNSKVNRKELENFFNRIRNEEPVASDFLPIEKKLIDLFKKTLQLDKEIRKTDTFFSLGGDSLSLVTLHQELQTNFNVDINLTDFYSRELTIESLADLVHTYRWKPSPSLPIALMENNEQGTQPIFFIHPITGEASSTYYTFVQEFLQHERNKHLKFFAINARGLSSSLDISSNLDLIARDYVNAIRSLQPQGPYMIFGWSFGGVLAWKITELLEEKKEKIDALVLLDSMAPYVARQCDSHDFDILLFQLTENIKPIFDIYYDASTLNEEAHRQDNASQKIKRFFQYLISVNTEQANLLQLVAALLLANQTYFPKGLQTIEPRLFSCAETRNQVSKWMRKDTCYDLEWHRDAQQEGLTTRSLNLSCNHFDFLTNKQLIKEISDKWRSTSLSSNSDLKPTPDIYVQLQVMQSMLNSLLSSSGGRLSPESYSHSNPAILYPHKKTPPTSPPRKPAEVNQKNN